MAKRRQEEEQELSWYDEPLYDTDDAADPFADDDDDLPVKERRGPDTSNLPREVGLIGGCFNVFLIAVVSILIFTLLGIGIVLGGRAAGLIPRIASAESEPTPQIVPIATSASVALVPVVESCEPQAWWNAQSGAFDYFVTLYDRATIAPLAGTLDELRAEMTARRDTAAAVPSAACLATARDALAQGMDDAIGAVESFAASGRRSAASQAESASASLANVLVALWDLGISTDLNTPPSLDIPRGGNCDAAQLAAWADRFLPLWQQVDALLSQTDLAAGNPADAQQVVTGLEAIRGNLTAIPSPQCVSRANELSLIGLNSTINGANLMQQGIPDAARESASLYARSRVTLNAWLAWLGVEIV